MGEDEEENNSTGEISAREIEELEAKEELEAAEYSNNLKGFYKMVEANNVWNLNKKGINSVRAAMSMLSSTHGMYSRIPIFCKGEKCPYTITCFNYQHNIHEVGSPCGVEIANIQRRYYEYAKEFDLDEENSSFTDRNLVNELITLEIYMDRCKSLMAIEGNPVQDIVIGISENGDEIVQPSISKAWEVYEKMSKKRNANYDLLMSTRRSKKVDKDTVGVKGFEELIAEATASPDFYDIEIENPTGDGNPISEEPSSRNNS